MKDENEKSTELFRKTILQLKKISKAKNEKQVLVWQEMLNQLPSGTDAWWELKRIAETAEFIKDNIFSVGNCGPEDAPMVVQMLKNLCHDYNSKNRDETQWMVSTVDGMEEYGVSTREAIRILGCALRIGILRESRFYNGDSEAGFIPSLLDVGKITHETLDHIIKAYEVVLMECGVKRGLLNKYYPEMEIDYFSVHMSPYVQ